MRYIQREVRTERREETVAAFLFDGELASAVCGGLDSSPGALILDHLIPVREGSETLEDWLVRQVREIFTTHIQTDDWQGQPDEWAGIRTQCTVEDVELSAEDCEWLVTRYVSHPDVLALWEEACREGREEKVAA